MKGIVRAFATQLLAGAFVAASLPASAGVILTSVSLTPFSEPGLAIETFDPSSAGSSFISTTVLNNARIVHDTVSGQYAMPFGHSTVDQYVSVFGGTSAEFNFSREANVLGIEWGSIDTYNSLDFYRHGVLVGHFTGSDLATSGVVTATGFQGVGGTGYARFMTDTFFDRLVMSSTTNSFEFDNLSITTVPTPATLSLFAVGLLGLGLLGRRLRRRAVA